MKLITQQLLEEYESLEAANDHAGAVLLLAENLGNEKDVFIISRINEIHERLGYLPETLHGFREFFCLPLRQKFRRLK